MQVGGSEHIPPPETPPELRRGWAPFAYYIDRTTGLPHRSGTVGDLGRDDGTHITAQEMAELERTGRLEQVIRRIQQARAAGQPYPERPRTYLIDSDFPN